ncbi:MAG TPA: ribosome silencing factor [Burkholderiales bacterium]|nr:ribosome silencing factor [Burkholderiales bacterium]
MRLDRIVKAAVSALEDIKARDIVVLNVTKMTAMFDRVIIASADSTRQTKALASNVQEKLKALGATIHGVEGEQAGEWILVDLGSVVVHIMQPSVRQYYNLEELWGGSAAYAARRRAARAQA